MPKRGPERRMGSLAARGRELKQPDGLSEQVFAGRSPRAGVS